MATQTAIKSLQNQPSASLTPIAAVTLANGQTTPVSHKLGRRPVFVMLGLLQTAGVSAGTIVEVSARDDKFIYLQANGFGATITIDLGVM